MGEVVAEVVAVQDERDVRGEDAAEEVGEGRFAGGGGAGEGDEVGGGVGHWGFGLGFGSDLILFYFWGLCDYDGGSVVVGKRVGSGCGGFGLQVDVSLDMFGGVVGFLRWVG